MRLTLPTRLPRLGLLALLMLLALLALLGGCSRVHGGVEVEPPRQPLVSSWMEPHGPPATAQQVAALKPEQWEQGSRALSRGFTSQAVWFRVEVSLPASRTPGGWVLEFGEPLLNFVDVHLPETQDTDMGTGPGTGSGNGWRVIRMGDKLPFASRPLASRNFAVPLDWAPLASTASVYVRVQSGTSIHLPTRLLSHEELIASDQQALVINAMYIGVMAGLLLYNLLLLLRVRELLYLYYAAWLFTFGLFVLCLDGMAFQYLWPQAPGLNDFSSVLSLLLSTFLLVAFWFRSVSENVRTSRLPRDRIWLTWMVVAALVAVLLPYRIAIQLTIVFTLACAAGQVWMATRTGRNRVLGMRSLLISYLPLLVAGYVLAMQRFGLFDSTPVIEYAVAVGSALQAIMLSALLGDRLSRVRELNATAIEMQRFNRSLGESNAALEASNCALREALHVSEARSRAIAEMKEKLRLGAEERNSEKSKFLAQAVHDLKQPLHAISIAVTPIQSLLGEDADSEIVELIDVVHRASLLMRNQIAGLLDLSRLESGFVRPQMSVFALRAFVLALLDPLQAYGHSRGVHIGLPMDEGDTVHVRSDPALLRQILSNFVSNAIKYADAAKSPHCKVDISWRIADDKVVIYVEDNGIGIEEQHLAERKIFQPFFQAHNSLPEGEKGVGLGLSIVNAAVALMPDHRISVASHFGSGSQFAVSVPKAAALPSAAEAGNQALARQADLASLAGKYVVLVDDDLLIRRSIVALLDHLGVLHDEFDSVADLSSKLLTLERRPDVLLSDYRLPDKKTALDVMALMAQIWPKVPTVVVTGDAEAAASLAERDDIVAVMHKPVSTPDLLNRLARACEEGVKHDADEEEDAPEA